MAAASGATAAEIPESGTLDLAARSDVRIDGLEEGSRAGFSVARAGDVNGDGLGDMLVGAPNADPGGRADAGSAFVIFGQREAAPIDLANLGGSGFRMDGPAAGDHAGFSVASAGDLNGDGRADLIVGAPAPGQERPGAAYVVYGKPDAGAIDLGSPGPGGYRIGGSQTGDYTGFSVASVGDLSGDGRPDLVVGAPRFDVDDTDRVDAGVTYVVHSTASPADVDLGSLGSGGYRIDGEAQGHSGFSVDGVGDMNGDGLGEVLVGAPFIDTPDVPRTGTAYVVFGRADNTGVDLSALGAGGFRLNGSQGRGPAAGSEDLRGADEGTTFEVDSDGSGEAAGFSVAAVGDVNGDNVPDIAVGGVLADRGSRLNAGSVYVVHGKAGPEAVELAGVGTEGGAGGFRVDGGARGDLLGTSMSDAGDVNADGRRDLLVSAPFADPLAREEAGSNYVIYGRESQGSFDLASIEDRGFRIAGPGVGDRASRQGAGVGDVNGDGAPDLLLGSALARTEPSCAPETSERQCPEETPDETERGPRAGAAFVVYSPKPAPPPEPDPGQTEEEEEDNCVAVRNVEVIVDDSGSMEGTDEEELRRRAVELLLQKPRNEGDVLGALEFGSEAFQLFPPEAIDPDDNDALVRLLARRIDADDGGTDYNSAFEIVADENPAAGARIFLTDGGHNEDEYVGGHAGGPPTYVLGLSIGRRGADARRLARIAEDTGGRYFPRVTSESLQRVMGRIDSRLNCDISLEDFTDVIGDEEEEEEYEEELDEDTHSSDITLSWDDATDDLEVERIVYRRGHGKAALGQIGPKKIRRAVRTGRRVRSGRLQIRAEGGTTYQALRVSGLGRGVLEFRVGATELEGRSRLTAQVAQSRRRR